MLKKPPLSFFGNKSRFANLFIKQLKEHFNDNYIYVDLFGGSGYLSYIVKNVFHDAHVIYNDYDNYMDRIKHIDDTNNILKEISDKIEPVKLQRENKLNTQLKNIILDIIDNHINNGDYVDIITLSSQLLYSGQQTSSLKKLKSTNFYNKINKNLLSEANAKEYLKIFNDIEIRNCDYKIIYEELKDNDNVVWLIDPPYLDTKCDTYQMSWNYEDFIDVLILLKQKNWFYFTSNRTKIYYFLKRFDEIFNQNILSNTEVFKRNNNINKIGKYEDYMIVKAST